MPIIQSHVRFDSGSDRPKMMSARVRPDAKTPAEAAHEFALTAENFDIVRTEQDVLARCEGCDNMLTGKNITVKKAPAGYVADATLCEECC